MFRTVTLLIAILAVSLPVSSRAVTLREVYEAAGPGGGYDRDVVLETGQVYTGGLLIGPILSPLSWKLDGESGQDVRITGNGAILDLRGEQICISYCENRLDIEDCIILNGNVRFRGMNTSEYVEIPTGSVRYCTFYGPHDYGVPVVHENWTWHSDPIRNAIPLAHFSFLCEYG